MAIWRGVSDRIDLSATGGERATGQRGVGGNVERTVFTLSTPVSLTATTLHYRRLPVGELDSRSADAGRHRPVSRVIPGITGATTAVEYYLTATDHRGQTRTAPADAPQKVFHITFATSGSSPGGDGGEEIPHSLRRTSSATWWMGGGQQCRLV